MKRPDNVYMCDFETTVYEGQEFTEVWAAACVQLFTEDVKIFHSIDEQFDYFISLRKNIICYYHNLKFDGNFWLSFLMDKLKFKQAVPENITTIDQIKFDKKKCMKDNTFSYSISSMGQWYRIIIKVKGKIIEIRDSLKLLPFSVKKLGKDFKTKHQKLEMEYTGFRYAGCEITPQEREYIANDVLVVKEALEVMFEQGHDKLTIGACCLSEYKRSLTDMGEDFDTLFPDLISYELNENIYGAKNADQYIRKSYRGGWCYLVEEKANKIFHNGTTADVNSLYPAVMLAELRTKYPTGTPTFWSGNYIPEQAKSKYYFIRFKTCFKIKENYLPFIQIKGSFLYRGTECLRTSDIYDPRDKTYHHFYKDIDGNPTLARPTLTMTMTDFELLKVHYDLMHFEILDGCYFDYRIGIFEDYIDKYKQIKINSTGAIRGIAKLFSNNLYGKMASNDNSSFKYAVLEDGVVKFMDIPEHEKRVGYIPVGSAITSYARNFTIRAAQKNYHGVNERGFIYADTDSIHCDLQPEEMQGITVHPTNYCCWKLETCWDTAIFARQKTYIEHVTHEDCKPIEKPYYNIKCAGMPENCKEILKRGLLGELAKPEEKLPEQTKDFLSVYHNLDEFKVGLKIWGKLLPKRIRGGVVLVETTYEMR